jgi:hypothetical protein
MKSAVQLNSKSIIKELIVYYFYILELQFESVYVTAK